MKKRVIIYSIVVIIAVVIGSFFLSREVINHLKDAASILGGISSIVVMIIAILLYDKFGIDKSIKDKNLATALQLLEELKKTFIDISGKGYILSYRVSTFPINLYESSYNTKLLFPKSYLHDLHNVFSYTDNIYLPKEIKEKLDKVKPSFLTKSSKEINEEEYGKVTVNFNQDTEWMFDGINDQKEITLFEYLVKWDELIMSIKDWCSNNSDTMIDLNVT